MLLVVLHVMSYRFNTMVPSTIQTICVTVEQPKIFEGCVHVCMTLDELSNHLLRPVPEKRDLNPPTKLSSLVVGDLPRGFLGDCL
jgi:hypothetical protein